MTETAYPTTPDEFATDLAALCDEARETPTTGSEFKADVKALVRAARRGGLTEEQIRTQIGAKADAMQAALERGA